MTDWIWKMHKLWQLIIHWMEIDNFATRRAERMNVLVHPLYITSTKRLTIEMFVRYLTRFSSDATGWVKCEMRVIDWRASSHTQHHKATVCNRVLSILRIEIHHCYRSVVCWSVGWLVDIGRACRWMYAHMCVCVLKGKKLLSCIEQWIQEWTSNRSSNNNNKRSGGSSSSIAIQTTNNLCVCVSDVRTFYYYYFCLIRAFVIFCLAYSLFGFYRIRCSNFFLVYTCNKHHQHIDIKTERIDVYYMEQGRENTRKGAMSIFTYTRTYRQKRFTTIREHIVNTLS